MSRFLRTPSPAMVVAVVALSLALVGSAVAGTSTLNKGVSKSKVKKIAKKQIKKAAPGLSVAHADTAAGPAGGALSGNYPDPTFRKNVVALTLNTGWEPDSGSATPSVWKDGYDVVHFIGSVARASRPRALSRFTLPPEFRPTTTKFPGVTVADGYGFLTVCARRRPWSRRVSRWQRPIQRASLDIEDVEFQAGTGASQAAAGALRVLEPGPAELTAKTAAPPAHIGSAQRDRGLRDRRRRLGRLRARQPADRGPLDACAPDRGRGQGPPARTSRSRPRSRTSSTPKLDWDYWTEPEPAVDGRSLYIPRGKSLGGSSSMNAMLYVRGRPLDYDLWASRARAGWGWNDVLPYFLRSEDNVRGASEFHGAGGEMRISEQRSPRPLNRRLLEAERRDRDPADRRLQRARAGRRLDVPGLPEGRPALERRRRVPAPRREAPEPRGRHRGHRARARARRRPRHRRALPARALGAERRRSADAGGDPAAPARSARRRSCMLSGIGPRDELRAARGRAAPRAPGRRSQPPGPSVPDDAVGGLGAAARSTGPTSPSTCSSGCCDGAARSPRPRPRSVAFVRTRPGSAGGRHPVPHGRAVLRGPRRRGVRRPRDDDRAGARQPEGARPGVAALRRPARQAADPHQLARRARRRRVDGRRDGDGARDRRRVAARRGGRPRAQAGRRRRRPRASSRPRCASGSS